MSTSPSFRLPFTLPEDVHPAVKEALRYTFNGLVDINQAIKVLKSQQTVATAVATTPVTTQAASGGSTTPATIGDVNLQPNPPGTSYTTQASDFGALIVVQSGVAFDYVLNSGLPAPFFTTVFNAGTGTVTATPSLGLVNNLASIDILPNQFAIVYFDGANWWAASYIIPKTIASATSKWLKSYDATTGLFTASQPLATEIDGTGLQAFADNAAAIAGGLVAGNLYRTGGDPDIIATVH